MEGVASGMRTLIEYGKKNLGTTKPSTVVVQGSNDAVPVKPPLQIGLGGTLSEADIPGFKWGKEKHDYPTLQGGPFENKVQAELGEDFVPTAWNFRSIDHWNADLGKAVSKKTFNTLTDRRVKTLV